MEIRHRLCAAACGLALVAGGWFTGCSDGASVAGSDMEVASDTGGSGDGAGLEVRPGDGWTGEVHKEVQGGDSGTDGPVDGAGTDNSGDHLADDLGLDASGDTAADGGSDAGEEVPCVPDCTGVACGDNGCGGECGGCAGGEQCVGGQCEFVWGEGSCLDVLSCAETCFQGGGTLVGCMNLCMPEGSAAASQAASNFVTCDKACGIPFAGKAQVAACAFESCTGDWEMCAGPLWGGGNCLEAKACMEQCTHISYEKCVLQCMPQTTPEAMNRYLDIAACAEVNCGCKLASGALCDLACIDLVCSVEEAQCAWFGCVPDCEGKNCGDDGCGGSCGPCEGAQEQCVAGSCVCTPQCDGKECGEDGCGSECGVCNAFPLSVCDAGACTCTPLTCDDLGLNCGVWDDGCGTPLDCGMCGDTCFNAVNTFFSPKHFAMAGQFTDSTMPGGSCYTGQATNAVWYVFSPAQGGLYTFTFTHDGGSTSATRMVLFDGWYCSPVGSEVACASSTTSTVAGAATLATGHDYLLLVHTDDQNHPMVDPVLAVVGP